MTSSGNQWLLRLNAEGVNKLQPNNVLGEL